MQNDEDINNLLNSAKDLVKNSSGATISIINSNIEAFSDEDILGFNDPSPLITKLSQINDISILSKLKKIIREIIFTDNHEEAFHLTLFLEEILYKNYTQLKIDNPEIFGEYEKILNIAKFICITTLNIDEIQILISNWLVEAIKNNVDVRDKMDEALRHYNDFIKDGEVSQLFYESLVKNHEMIGKNHLSEKMDITDPLPTVKNWVLDYFTFSRVNINDKRSTFHRINYFNKSQNIKELNKNEKVLLNEVLEILDWLEFGDVDNLDNVESEKYLNNNDSSYRNISSFRQEGGDGEDGKDVDGVLGYEKQSQIAVRSPIPPTPSNFAIHPSHKATEDTEASSDKPTNNNLSVPPQAGNLTSQGERQSPAKPQVSLTPPTPSLKKRGGGDVDIDKKLLELKNRVEK